MTTPAFPDVPPIDIAPRDWADVVRILHEQVPVIEVWAFGSRVKHKAKPYSDLDLALITQQPLEHARQHADQCSDGCAAHGVVQAQTKAWVDLSLRQ